MGIPYLYVSEESGGKWFSPKSCFGDFVADVAGIIGAGGGYAFGFSVASDFVGDSAPCCPLGVTLRQSSFVSSDQVTKCCSAHK